MSGGIHRIDSNSVGKLEGTIYLPNATLISNSNSQISADSSYTMIIAAQVEINSNAELILNSNYEAIGGPPLPNLLSIAKLRR